jgi:hypothetical protein
VVFGFCFFFLVFFFFCVFFLWLGFLVVFFVFCFFFVVFGFFFFFYFFFFLCLLVVVGVFSCFLCLKQRPATHHPVRRRVHWGRQPKIQTQRARTFRYPTACPTRSTRSCVPRRSSTNKTVLIVPNSQRSTHEQPPSNICRRSGL